LAIKLLIKTILYPSEWQVRKVVISSVSWDIDKAYLFCHSAKQSHTVYQNSTFRPGHPIAGIIPREALKKLERVPT
jgi:hypothetical protein